MDNELFDFLKSRLMILENENAPKKIFLKSLLEYYVLGIAEEKIKERARSGARKILGYDNGFSIREKEILT